MKYLAATVQMTSTNDLVRNAERALELVAEAADRGATLIGLPENWLIFRESGDPRPAPVNVDSGPFAELRALCKEKEVTLVAGTIPEAAPSGKLFNTCHVIGPDGGIVASYRKIHLFDVSISGGEAHKESEHIMPGREAIVAKTDSGPVGLTICYDLRFPELFRLLALRGARVIFTPAAFTLHTGKDHWIALLRARAIENLVYIVAPAQYGQNTKKRQTFGKSLIADPWGNVIATVPDREGIAIAEIDFEAQDAIRAQLPSLKHFQSWLFDEIKDNGSNK
ncbi:MAG: carbon-nitrogen hydrolase family protein [bacterium]